jgi:phosphoribosyl-ATP pyrophosphohydrolase
MTLDELYLIISERKQRPSPGSYTAHLLSLGENEILKKIGEETMEVIIAAKDQGDARLVEEIADLQFHLLVLMALHNLAPSSVYAELERRHSQKRGLK